jgi:hypothetical protein
MDTTGQHSGEPDITEQFREELGPPPDCVFCGSADTQWYALFGTLLSTSQVYCTKCRTVFEVLKDWTAFAPEETES